MLESALNNISFDITIWQTTNKERKNGNDTCNIPEIYFSYRMFTCHNEVILHH